MRRTLIGTAVGAAFGLALVALLRPVHAFRADYLNTGSAAFCTGIAAGDLCVPGKVLGATPFRFEGSTRDGTNFLSMVLGIDPIAPYAVTLPADEDYTLKKLVSEHTNTAIKTWWCDTVNTSCTQATTPNVDNIGSLDSIEWAAGENANPITTQLVVPDDYVSDPLMIVYVTKDALTSDDDTMQFQWLAVSGGDAVNPSLIDEGSVSIPHATTLSRITWDLDGGTLTPDDVIHFHLLRSAGSDENIHVTAAYFEYMPK